MGLSAATVPWRPAAGELLPQVLTCTCCSFCCSSALSASAASALWLNRASSTSSCCRRALSALAALHNTCVQRVVLRDRPLPADDSDAVSAVFQAICAGYVQQPTDAHAVVLQLHYTYHTCPSYPECYGEVLRDVCFNQAGLWRPALPACAGAHRVSTNGASSERVHAGPTHHVHSPKQVHVGGCWMAFGAACLVLATSTAAVWNGLAQPDHRRAELHKAYVVAETRDLMALPAVLPGCPVSNCVPLSAGIALLLRR